MIKIGSISFALSSCEEIEIEVWEDKKKWKRRKEEGEEGSSNSPCTIIEIFALWDRCGSLTSNQKADSRLVSWPWFLRSFEAMCRSCYSLVSLTSNVYIFALHDSFKLSRIIFFIIFVKFIFFFPIYFRRNEIIVISNTIDDIKN